MRRIQKIIAGDQADGEHAEQAADRLLRPARQDATENVSTAAKLPASVTAPSTPSQIGAVDSAGSPPRSARAAAVLRTAASRMVTTRPASRPSRSPISRLGTLSAQVTRTKVRLT